MADIIDILPDHVANQIAAGEVIQRPASVVKELLENAVDAGADQIKLIIKDAGRTLVQVTDNGCGMSFTDARKCFERHATSKIRDAADIFSVRTKGFRGEALASIAAVAQVELLTKKREDDVATRLQIEGSEVKLHEIAGGQDGSTLQVKNLFYNIPARRNFLKSNPVETRHIMDEFHRVAIAHPGISFSLYHNDSEVYQLPAGSLRQRLVSLFGKNFNQRIVPLEEETGIANISGFIGKPEFSRKTRGEQYFFVNNRFIKSPYLHHAVQFAYKELLQEDAYPAYFVFLDVDPATIDVNIHPTKTEVKFEDEKALYAILQSTIKRSLGQYNIAPSLDFEQESAFDHVPPPGPGHTIRPPQVKVDPDYNPFKPPRPAAPKTDTEFNMAVDLQRTAIPPVRMHRTSQESIHEPQQQVISAAWDHEQDDTDEKFKVQLHNTYILTQIKSGLLVIHQQLAHERILYERFLDHLETAQGSCQQLLFPETIELQAEDLDILREIEEDVKALGFDITDFGKQTVVLNGIPADLSETGAGGQLEQLVEQYKSNQTKFKLDKRENLARSLARNASIKPGKKLGKEEMDNLIHDLFACKQPNVAPDGRPAITTITSEQMLQNFKSR
ncbi:MAG: DNA mismatch repair endonuclease MutL [Flavobacteriales bacterium]|nr:DNA mismatch repair endonuclease MutL [Flavobacteriales bacterium]MCB9448805.1 DNA mismatch repair endonuclease MutL [Flavobacteriales bacterium]